ncbi:MAG TPA: hypothetical protein VKH40_11090 [Alloacidobacterium sp.]|nr:hypothetical protein [Alloacidobacterium sp.]
MSEPDQTDRRVVHPEAQRTAKKPYCKPEFRFEQVFETRALACGKVVSTQEQCLHNRKSS